MVDIGFRLILADDCDSAPVLGRQHVRGTNPASGESSSNSSAADDTA
jgi:hypothetical protein